MSEPGHGWTRAAVLGLDPAPIKRGCLSEVAGVNVLALQTREREILARRIPGADAGKVEAGRSSAHEAGPAEKLLGRRETGPLVPLRVN